MSRNLFQTLYALLKRPLTKACHFTAISLQFSLIFISVTELADTNLKHREVKKKTITLSSTGLDCKGNVTDEQRPGKRANSLNRRYILVWKRDLYNCLSSLIGFYFQ